MAHQDLKAIAQGARWPRIVALIIAFIKTIKAILIQPWNFDGCAMGGHPILTVLAVEFDGPYKSFGGPRMHFDGSRKNYNKNKQIWILMVPVNEF